MYRSYPHPTVFHADFAIAHFAQSAISFTNLIGARMATANPNVCTIDVRDAPDALVPVQYLEATSMGSNLVVDEMDIQSLCRRCGYAGCDVRSKGCGCLLHARCAPLPCASGSCPHCGCSGSEIVLLPMSFREIEEVRWRRSNPEPAFDTRKRKNSMVHDDCIAFDQRTGRWTPEETVYVDNLISKFELGCLPLVNGTKLNDFLAGMLQCKQSRLTKKMKNSKLSSKCFKRTSGHIKSLDEAREFSMIEAAFLKSVQCPDERAAIKFHSQKQWRELFSNYCVSLGQPLDADAWLTSVEEIERRATLAKNAARMARRKLMMGKALKQDRLNPDSGVIIDDASLELMTDDVRSSSMVSDNTSDTAHTEETEDFLSVLTDNIMFKDGFSAHPPNSCDNLSHGSYGGKTLKSRCVSSPFLEEVMSFVASLNAPFEHADAWVPSMVQQEPSSCNSLHAEQSCRLCYAGSASANVVITPNGSKNLLTPGELFNLTGFAKYSEKFSFKIGCGLPGKVFESGNPRWEQNVQRASFDQFERSGGAKQFGIKTSVGISVPSATVGRIIVLLYSFHMRIKDQDIIQNLHDKLSELVPSPTWKLVVELGETKQLCSAAPIENGGTLPSSPHGSESVSSAEGKKDPRIDQVVKLLGQHMPSDPSSPFGVYLQGFMSLRLLLLRSSHSASEHELVQTLLSSYSSYAAGGRSTADIAMLLARDCMFLMQNLQQVQ